MLLGHGSDFCIVYTPIYAVPASAPQRSKIRDKSRAKSSWDADNKVRGLNRVHPIHKTDSVK